MGSDFWFMGLRCDYRVTQQSLLGMAAGVLLSIVLLGAVLAAIAVRRFKALLLEARADQTRSRWEHGAAGAWTGVCRLLEGGDSCPSWGVGARSSRESHGGVAGLGLSSAKENSVGWLIAAVGGAGVGQLVWGPGEAAPGATAVPPGRVGLWVCARCQRMLPATGSGVHARKGAGGLYGAAAALKGCAAVDRRVRCADELQLRGPWDPPVLPMAQGPPAPACAPACAAVEERGSGTALTKQLIRERGSAVLAPLPVS